MVLMFMDVFLQMIMTSNLSICHVNCQSLLAHFDEFRDFFSRNFYHIIALSETWLKPHVNDTVVSLSDHGLIRWDRLGKAGGDVGLYVHRALKVKVLANSGSVYCSRPVFNSRDFWTRYF